VKAIRRVGHLAQAAQGRQLFEAVFKTDMSEGVAWVLDSDVREADEVITEAQYSDYATAYSAWNEANTPAPAPDPMETELAALTQLLGPDWDGSEAAWAGLTAAQRTDHLRARANALRRSVIYIVRYIQGRDDLG
jgi:hypothetical protein